MYFSLHQLGVQCSFSTVFVVVEMTERRKTKVKNGLTSLSYLLTLQQ